jgi:hypothetical protein
VKPDAETFANVLSVSVVAAFNLLLSASERRETARYSCLRAIRKFNPVHLAVRTIGKSRQAWRSNAPARGHGRAGNAIVRASTGKSASWAHDVRYGPMIEHLPPRLGLLSKIAAISMRYELIRLGRSGHE